MNKLIPPIVTFAAMSFAQTTGTGANQRPSKKTKDEITATGCVIRLNSHFILMQEGHSYQLEESKTVKLGSYLGQEVEVTGVESLPMSTSSPRASGANPVSITVHSIKSIHSRCVN
jgi:hypothetical protein